MAAQKNKRMQKIESAFIRLKNAEKFAVIIGVLVFIFFAWFVIQSNLLDGLIVFDVTKKEVILMKKEIVTLQKKTQSKTEQSLLVEEKKKTEELNQVRSEIAMSGNQLLTNDQLLTGLRSLLRENPELKLTLLANLPLQKVKETASLPLFISPFEMSIQGNYYQLVDYLQKIEKHYPYIFWDEMSYKTLKYPDTDVVLKFHIFIIKTEKNDESHR